MATKSFRPLVTSPYSPKASDAAYCSTIIFAFLINDLPKPLRKSPCNPVQGRLPSHLPRVQHAQVFLEMRGNDLVVQIGMNAKCFKNGFFERAAIAGPAFREH